MGKLRGFMEHERVNEQNVAVQDRVKNYKEFTVTPSEETLQEQGARCMDCGVPFCHSHSKYSHNRHHKQLLYHCSI